MASSSNSINALADYLATGYWQSTGQTPHHFDGHTITVDLTGLNGAGKTLARAALDAWESVADLRFKEKRSGADITFGDHGGSADTQVKMNGHHTISADVTIGTGWLHKYGSSVGTYGFQTYIHEIGHALGLGHSGNYNGGASFSQARFANDSWQTTVMSYFDQDENPNVAANKAYVVTPMAADILAIQQIYGRAHGGPTSGSTHYGDDVNLSRNAMTICDVGGKDTIDLGRDSHAQDVDLADGSFSDVFGLVGNLGIAQGTIIENLIDGSGDDRVSGNRVGNCVWAGKGDDSVQGKDGSDHLYGQWGNDSLNGGEGNDILSGGSNFDSFVFQAGHDTITDFEDNRDTLVLDKDLWGGGSRTVSQVLDFAHVVSGGIEFDFGGGDTLLVKGTTNIDALADDLAFA